MNLCVRTVFISLWLFLTSALSAQLGLSLPVINNITPGALVSFTVTVSDFDSIVGMQYVIRWDPEVFEYDGTGSYNLPELSTDDFGTTQALDSGILRVLWVYSNLLGGVSVNDGTSIFRLRLNAIGPVGSGSPILFTEDVDAVRHSQGQQRQFAYFLRFGRCKHPPGVRRDRIYGCCERTGR